MNAKNGDKDTELSVPALDSLSFIENTIQLFEISNETSNLVLETYDDPKLVLNILNEKTRDVLLMAKISRILLEKNKRLQSQIVKFTSAAQDWELRTTYLEQQNISLRKFIDDTEAEDEDIFMRGLASNDDWSKKVDNLISENRILIGKIEDMSFRPEEDVGSRLEEAAQWQMQQTSYFEKLNERIESLEDENSALRLEVEYRRGEEIESRGYRVEEGIVEDSKTVDSRYEENEEIMKQTIVDLNDAVEDYRAQLSVAYNRVSRLERAQDGYVICEESEGKSLQSELDELAPHSPPGSSKVPPLTGKNRLLRQLETARIIQKAKKCLEVGKWSIYDSSNVQMKSSIILRPKNAGLQLVGDNKVPESRIVENGSVATLTDGEGCSSNVQGIQHRHTGKKSRGTDCVIDAWSLNSKSMSGGSSKSSSEAKQALTIIKPIDGSNTMAAWKRLGTPGMSSILGSKASGVVGRLLSANPNVPHK